MAEHMKPGDVGDFADPHDMSLLAEPLRSRLWTMFKDCPQPMRLVSGMRSPWQQWLLRHERCPGHEFDMRACPGNPVTAIPYSSQHQKGLAADMGGTGMGWCLQRLADYGLARTVSSELWHVEARGTPKIRIHPYGKASGWAPAATYPAGGVHPRNVGEVLWAQDTLNLFRAHQGLPFIERDGHYGAETRKACAEFQKFCNAMAALAGSTEKPWSATGVMGPKTVAAMDWWLHQWFPAKTTASSDE